MRRNGWLILASFLAGIVLANLSGKDMLTTYGILNTSFLDQYARRGVDSDLLFCHVALERAKTAFVLFVCGGLANGALFLVVAECVFALCFGFLLAVAVVNLGILGIAVMLCGMFPQWLFYFAAIILFASYRGRERYPEYQGRSMARALTARGGLLLFLLLLLVLGIITESYVNPLLFRMLLEIA